MRTANVLAAAFVALSSLPLLAQQSPDQPPASAAAGASQPSATTAPATVNPAEFSPVRGELVDKLDSKTAKAGDSVVVKTKDKVKTADGTEIPKGSKLLGHVTGVKASGGGSENSQVMLAFDRIELKGGQSLAIHSEIQGLSPSDSELSSSGPSGILGGGSPSASGPAASPGGAIASGAPAASPSANAAQMPSQANSGAPAGDSQSTAPAAGTVVARSGNIAIRTTSIPGVLLASNEPGQQDPRLAQSSGILLGARRDIHLDGGTQVLIGVVPATGNSGGN